MKDWVSFECYDLLTSGKERGRESEARKNERNGREKIETEEREKRKREEEREKVKRRKSRKGRNQVKRSRSLFINGLHLENVYLLKNDTVSFPSFFFFLFLSFFFHFLLSIFRYNNFTSKSRDTGRELFLFLSLSLSISVHERFKREIERMRERRGRTFQSIADISVFLSFY